ncbi:MAG: hypothetical protein OEV44_12970, partial [Spirochaetota bacterium]|nr:hypothetical protein [Spirochaetota bacterium]
MLFLLNIYHYIVSLLSIIYAQKGKWISIIAILLSIPHFSYAKNHISKNPGTSVEIYYLKKHNQSIIQEIKISDNYKAKNEKILLVLDVKVGEVFFAKKFYAGIQRLRNTDFFYEINYQIKKLDSKKIKIILKVKDKWSILPIISYKSGGGISHYRFGIYEANLFGELMEIGGTYENLNKESYGRVWFEDRYFFNTYIRFRINLFSDGMADNFYSLNRDILLQLITRKNGGSFEFHFPIIRDILTLTYMSAIYQETIKKNLLL